MSILDGLFIGLVSGTILFFFFGLLFLGVRLKVGKKIKNLERLRPKNEKKRRRLMKVLRGRRAKAKKYTRNSLILLTLGLLCLGGSVYSRYYQSTSLSERDSEAIVEGYYLLQQTENQMLSINETDNVEKTRSNLRELSARMASFGTRQADGRINLEGQKLLNRYYSLMKELGLNLNNQSIESLQNLEIYDEYMMDIEKTKEAQGNVIEKFKVNEQALQQNQ